MKRSMSYRTIMVLKNTLFVSKRNGLVCGSSQFTNRDEVISECWYVKHSCECEVWRNVN